jgi:hypothetical protein
LRERVKVYPENSSFNNVENYLKTKLSDKVQNYANSIEYSAIKYISKEGTNDLKKALFLSLFFIIKK